MQNQDFILIGKKYKLCSDWSPIQALSSDTTFIDFALHITELEVIEISQTHQKYKEKSESPKIKMQVFSKNRYAHTRGAIPLSFDI